MHPAAGCPVRQPTQRGRVLHMTSKQISLGRRHLGMKSIWGLMVEVTNVDLHYGAAIALR